MRTAAFTLFLVFQFACAPATTASTVRAPYESGVAAVVDGLTSVCSSAFEAAARGRRGSTASAEHLAQAGWVAADPIPDGHLFDPDPSARVGQAPLEEGAAERVVAAVSISHQPECSIIIYDRPQAVGELVEHLNTDPAFTRLSIGAAANAGIDMFGFLSSNPAADFGVTIYTPADSEMLSAGVGALVTVTLIPKASIQTGVFPPAE